MIRKTAYPLVNYLFDHPGVRLARVDMFPKYRPDVKSLGARHQSFAFDMANIVRELNSIVSGIIKKTGARSTTRYLLCPDLEVHEETITKPKTTTARKRGPWSTVPDKAQLEVGLVPDARPVVKTPTVVPELDVLPSPIEQSIEQILR